MILVIQSAEMGERRVPLQRGVLTLGRGADCDLVLADSQASRRHAELRRAGERWQIVDLGSTNGTFMSGGRLAPNVARSLRPGEVVTIGSTRLHLVDEAPAPAAVPWAEAPLTPAMPDAARPSLLLTLLIWFSRLLVLAGAAALMAGAQAEWLRLAVTLPLLGNVLNRTISGLESGYAYLLIGVGALGLLLLLVDLLSRRWGLAAGLAQALLGGLTAVTLAFNAYTYYQAGAQTLFGISMLDILTQYARDLVQITVLPGIYLVGGGLAGLILGGLLRLIFAGME
ncbi:FHA domain-containing protein [Candidatus Amarolinea dominans]|uniref:FHA domain-containing protein n=1 Tax=Candidatus Amarolinea dominans TaxID=3140696 RepID=UPI0031369DC1|nr:FHA domain-containing protein [Anaerolineae bacterium]